MKKALILIDLENEWIQKDSPYFIGDISCLLEKTNKLLRFCREQGYKIFFIRHIEKDSDTSFAPRSSRIEIFPGLEKDKSDVIVDKYKISPFYQTNLEQELSGTGHLVIGGILTNLCVRSCVQDAYDRDFHVTVITDCCQAFTQEIHDFTLKDLKETREEIEIKTLDVFIQTK